MNNEGLKREKNEKLMTENQLLRAKYDCLEKEIQLKIEKDVNKNEKLKLQVKANKFFSQCMCLQFGYVLLFTLDATISVSWGQDWGNNFACCVDTTWFVCELEKRFCKLRGHNVHVDVYVEIYEMKISFFCYVLILFASIIQSYNSGSFN